ncbi:MAG: hypothetical protein R2715_23305 [Ilumatobacteraceae bacterium]
MSHDADAARRALMNGDVDLIVTVPDQPVDQIMSANTHRSRSPTPPRPDPALGVVFACGSPSTASTVVLARIVSAGQDAGSEAIDDRDGVASLLAGPTDSGVAQARASAFRDLLHDANGPTRAGHRLDPRLIARPFEADVVLVPRATRMTDWYVPAALVLVVQQQFRGGVRRALLRTGPCQVFQVAPVSAARGAREVPRLSVPRWRRRRADRPGGRGDGSAPSSGSGHDRGGDRADAHRLGRTRVRHRSSPAPTPKRCSTR